MPTGYTAAVEDGSITTLRAFVLRCARAFGACVSLRDEPLDAPIPEVFEPQTRYHDDVLATARATLTEMPTLSPEECERRAVAEWQAACARHEESNRMRVVVRERYEAMIAKVEAWTAPTYEHAEFRTWMLKQLRDSISFDCDYTVPEPTRLSVSAWREGQIIKAKRDVEYHERERAAEIERAESRTAWIAALRASLKETD